MVIRRWTPYTDLGTLRSRMNHLFEDFYRDYSGEERESTRELVFHPPVDIKENQETLTVSMEIPGVKKDDISIELNDNVLTIKGSRRFEKEEKGETYHRVERSYGTFTRSFSLSSKVNADKINASCGDGILTLTLPKAEEAKPKKIAIKG